MSFLKFFIAILITFFFSQIALAQEVSTGLFDSLPNGLMPKIIMWVIALQALAFGIGKGLTEVAALTENKWDNMIANGFTKVAWFLGTLISKFGWSMPKQVVLKQAAKIEAKK